MYFANRLIPAHNFLVMKGVLEILVLEPLFPYLYNKALRSFMYMRYILCFNLKLIL